MVQRCMTNGIPWHTDFSWLLWGHFSSLGKIFLETSKPADHLMQPVKQSQTRVLSHLTTFVWYFFFFALFVVSGSSCQMFLWRNKQPTVRASGCYSESVLWKTDKPLSPSFPICSSFTSLLHESFLQSGFCVFITHGLNLLFQKS